MKNNYTMWLEEQDEEFKQEVGTDLKTYISKPLTLAELEELDNKFINNPEGSNNE